jgi:hypothetical protein
MAHSADAEYLLEKARSNRDTAEVLRKAGDYNWALVLLFYCVLRIVDAWFVENGYGKPVDHAERFDWLRTYLAPGVTPSMQRIRYDYRRLYGASKDARYEYRDFTDTEVQECLDREFGYLVSQLARKGIAL